MSPFKPFTLNIKGRLIRYDRPVVMGILNVTPDSFYAGSRTMCDDSIAKRVVQMVEAGADMIDIGGYSSRPGADDVPADEELRRLAAGLEAVHRLAPHIITSVDTFRADVARKAVTDHGADIINDISGGTLDNDMFATVASLRVPYVLMHMRGTPATMQSYTDYSGDGGDVTAAVMRDLAAKIAKLTALGVNDIITDPGFGFSKTAEQNFKLLQQLELFARLNCPVLVGISRKSMIYKTLGITPAESLDGTSVLNALAVERGASILRVHDVAEARRCITLVGHTLYSE